MKMSIIPNDSNSFEALVGELWRCYRKVIQAGFFSLYDGAFRPFNDDECRLIRAATIRSDDDDA